MNENKVKILPQGGTAASDMRVVSIFFFFSFWG